MDDLEKQERALVEGYRKLPPESQNYILSTVITAITAQEAALREFTQHGARSPAYALQGPVMEGLING